MTALWNEPIARALFQAQALATMGLDPDWDAAIAGYFVWDIKARADEEYGPLERESWARQHEKDEAEQRFGKDWRGHPEGRKIWERHLEWGARYDEARTRDFYNPMWAAHRRLVETPSPSLAAVAVKAAIIEWHEVWNDGGLEGDCVSILDADLKRLTIGARQ